MTGQIQPLSTRLGHSFATPGLLTLALTHRSWCAEHPEDESNERLEFLGDSVLSLAVTDHLMSWLPEAAEGELAKVRATVVSAPVLAAIAQALGLGEDLRLGRGEVLSGGRSKQSILADALEAVIGAVYLDAGWPQAREFVLRIVGEHLELAAIGPGGQDYKTRLQELVARRFDSAPSYVIAAAGPDHEKRFTATVQVRGEVYGSGEGSSKKQAEQDAARRAWAALTEPVAHHQAGRANA